jgi:hypothetical protein
MRRGLVQVADNSEQSGFYLIKRLAVSVVVTILTIPLAAQTAPAGGSNDAWSPAKSIGMFAYPTKNQNADQQLKDESQCYGSAKQNTGVDPQAPAPAAPSAESQQAAQQNAAKQAGNDVKNGPDRKFTPISQGCSPGFAVMVFFFDDSIYADHQESTIFELKTPVSVNCQISS